MIFNAYLTKSDPGWLSRARRGQHSSRSRIDINASLKTELGGLMVFQQGMCCRAGLRLVPSGETRRLSSACAQFATSA